jgi:transposase
MPSSDGKRGNRFRDHRTIVEAVVYRFRTGIAWRDLPERFGPWQTGRNPANDATPEVVGCRSGWSRKTGTGSGDGEA